MIKHKSYQILFVLICCLISTQQSKSQTYIDSKELIKRLELEVNKPDFSYKNTDHYFESFHENKENRKVKINLLPIENKALEAEEIFEKTFPSVYIFLQVYDSKKLNTRKINGAGTAFPISNDGYFAINYHMIEELGIGNGDPSKVDTSIHLVLADYAGNIYSIDSVVSYNKQADIALLKANTRGKKISANPLGNDLKAGAEVFALTHPKDYFYYFSSGRVARMTQDLEQGIFSRKMEITADYAAGSSGGPIYDNKGNIAGMVSLTKSFYYNPKEQQNLQMVIKETIPVSAIRALLR